MPLVWDFTQKIKDYFDLNVRAQKGIEEEAQKRNQSSEIRAHGLYKDSALPDKVVNHIIKGKDVKYHPKSNTKMVPSKRKQ